MAAIYAVYTSPTHPPIPNHLPTLIVTPHGQPSNILYSYLHTNFNSENYLLTPSPQGDLCVAKLFPPRPNATGKASASDPGHSSPASSRVVRCEASRNLKWSIANTGVISPIYKLSLPSPDSPDLPLFQVSKPNPNAAFWSMFYFAYAGHNIPPKRIEFGKIQKNPPGPNGGGTRISITGKTPEEKAVWQTLGEGNEDCVEWVVLCAALNLLDDEIIKAADKHPAPPSLSGAQPNSAPGGRPAPVSLRDPGPASAPPATTQPPSHPRSGHMPPNQQQQVPPPRGPGGPGVPHAHPNPGPGRPPPGYFQQRGFAPGQGPPPPHAQGVPGQNARPAPGPTQTHLPPPQGIPGQATRNAQGPPPSQVLRPPPPGAMVPQGHNPMTGYAARPQQLPPTQGYQQPMAGPPQQIQSQQPGVGQQPQATHGQPRRF